MSADLIRIDQFISLLDTIYKELWERSEILEKELEEAKNGWMKNKTGKDSALAEIRQIAAVALACIQQHGIEGNQ